jgi:FMN phosphatase YigB (HAD superfamily)
VPLAADEPPQNFMTARGVEVVLLDWGNTLMVDDGSRPGPMATWDRVAATPGAHEALRRLHPRYRLVIATNAEESGAPEVRAALARVGLDGLVDDIVTSRDVGVRKPDPAFFAAALRVGFADRAPLPGRAVMVGDSWENDVVGAAAAGLRTIWLRDPGARRPEGATAPDAEIAHMSQLPEALGELA